MKSPRRRTAFNYKKQLVRIILAVVCLLALIVPVSASPQEQTVRVGIYELEGFHSFEGNGRCVGYDIDYLNRIANVTGWKYQFVKASSWSQAMSMLRKGEIDLLSPSQMTKERFNEFSFSTFPIGKVYGAVLTMEDNPTTYEDFAAFSHMTFGIEQGNTYQGIFMDYAKENGFQPQLRFYPNHNLLVAALRAGRVDAIVANVMRAEPDMRLLGKAGTAQFYYMYRKEDVALGNALNDALDHIEIDEPNFQTELVSTYFPIYGSEPFSKAELDYVEHLPVVRVACPAGAFPHSYLEPQSGELKGILVDYLTASGKKVGLRYEFIPCTLEEITESFIQKNKINLVVESGLSPIEKNRSKGVYSNNILKTQQLIVGAEDMDFSVDRNMTIAWYGINNIGSKNMRNSFPRFNWKAYTSMEACLEAVKNGEADGCMLNQFAANWFLAKPRYESFQMVSSSSVAQSICLASGVEGEGFDPKDPMFIKVLNKSFKQLSNLEEQQITIKYTTAMPYKLTLLETIYKYRLSLLLLVALLGSGIGGLVFYAHKRALQAQVDPLTGLYNRSFAKKQIVEQIESQASTSGALVILDLDHFKTVNDTLGHQQGDALLLDVAEKLRKHSRKGDTVGRLGGDEFFMYFPCEDAATFLPGRLEALRKSLEQTIEGKGLSVQVSASMGVALMPKDGKEITELYKHADEALYKAKEEGRNRYRFYSEL